MALSGPAPGPEPPPTTADTPPYLPPGWHATPRPAASDGQALLLWQRPGRRRAQAAGAGVTAIALWAWTVALAAGDHAAQDKPWIWVMGAAAALCSWFAVRRARLAEAWEVSAGRLLIGEVRARSGRWRRPPYSAAALELTRHETDGSQHHRLSAVIPPTGRWETLFDGPDDDSVRSLGAWLAAQADIPFTDHTRPPG